MGHFWFTSGTYTGNGSVRSFTGLGFQPQMVTISNASRGDVTQVTQTSMGTNYSDILTADLALVTGLITSLDSDGFSIGTDNSVNRTDDTFVWTAWRQGADTTKYFEQGKYTGNGATPRTITTSIIPNMITVNPAFSGGGQVTAPTFKTSDHTDITTDSFYRGLADYTSSQGIRTLASGTNYTVDIYNQVGEANWTAPTGVTSVDVLIVGGGGGGGSWNATSGTGGGGGAGEASETTLSVSSGQTYKITVGGGGAGAIGANYGSNGSDSSFGTLKTALGGGGGGHGQPYDGLSGACGGGAGGSGGTSRNGGIGSPGYNGGANRPGAGKPAGGGGGMTAVGQQPVDVNTGGNGGAGITSSISGYSVQYAGGGGGAVRNGTYTAGSGVYGGGNGGAAVSGSNATDNTGGGGGGGSGGNGGNGGSGIVIIRYITPITTNNFIIGSSTYVNSSSNTYNYFGLANLTGHIKEGTYTGNGSARSITGLGFKPDFIVIKGADSGKAVFTSRDYTAGTTLFFDGTASSTTAITSLDSDGFSLGTDSNVNTDTIKYYYYAIIKHNTKTYTINSNANIKKEGIQKTITSFSRTKKNNNQKTITENDKIKKKGIQYSITSNANIKKLAIYTITSNAKIKKLAVQQIITENAKIKKLSIRNTILSDAKKKKKYSYIILSVTKIKHLAYQRTMIQNAKIKKNDIMHSILSISFKKKRIQKSLNSNSFRKKLAIHNLTSFLDIFKQYSYSITSKSYIKKSANKKTITERYYVKKLANVRTLNSNAYIAKNSAYSILGFLRVKKYSRKTLTCRLQIRPPHYAYISSNSNIGRASRKIKQNASIFRAGTQTITCTYVIKRHILRCDYKIKQTYLKIRTSNSKIKKLDNQKTISLNNFIKKRNNRKLILFRSFIKKVANLRNRLSNAFIGKTEILSLTSNYFVKKVSFYHNHILVKATIKQAYQKTRTCNAKVKKLANIYTILSNSFIKKRNNRYTIRSSSNIFKLGFAVINCNDKIKKLANKSISQIDYIKKRNNQKTITCRLHIKKGLAKTITSFLRVKVLHTQKTRTCNAKVRTRNARTLNSNSFIMHRYTGGTTITVQNTNIMDSSTDADTFQGVAPYSGGIYRVTVNMISNPTATNVRLKLTIGGNEYLSDNTVSVNIYAFLSYNFYFNSRPRIILGQTLYVTKIHTLTPGQTVNIRTSNYGDNSGWNFHFDRGPDVMIILLKDLTSLSRIKKTNLNTLTSRSYIRRRIGNNIIQNAELRSRKIIDRFSDLNIKSKPQKQIISIYYIFTPGLEGSIYSNAIITHRTQKTLSSNANIFKRTIKSLNSSSNILKSAHKPMTTRSYIKKSFGGIPTPTNDSNVVSIYRMNEIQWNGLAGEVIDSKNNNSGTSLQNSQTVSNGLFDRAGSFTGTRSGVALGSGATLHSNYVSVNAWVNPTSVSKTYNDIINSGRYRLTIRNNSRVEWWVYTSNDGWISATSNSTITLNQWTQISGTYDGSRAKLYINGVLQTTQGIGTAVISWAGNAVYIGQSGANTNEYAGLLDEVAIWNKGITASQVMDMFKQNTMLNSNYVIVKRFQKTCVSNYRIRRRVQKSLSSRLWIKKRVTKTLTSRAFIIKRSTNTITQNDKIKKLYIQRTLTQRAYVIKTRRRDILQDAFLERRAFEHLTSFLDIFKKSTKTINSVLVVTKHPLRFMNSRAYITQLENKKTITSKARIEKKYQHTILARANLKQTYYAGITKMESNTNTQDSSTFVDTFSSTAPRRSYIYGINVHMLAIGTPQDVYLKVTVVAGVFYSIPITVQTSPFAPGYQFWFETEVPVLPGEVFSVQRINLGTVEILTSTAGDNSGWNCHFDEGPIVRIYTINPIEMDAFITKKGIKTITSRAQIFKRKQFSLTCRLEINKPVGVPITSDSWIKMRAPKHIYGFARLRKANPGVRKTLTSRMHLGIAGEWSDIWCVDIISPNIGQLRSNYMIFAHTRTTIFQDAEIKVLGIHGITCDYFLNKRYQTLINMNIYIRSGAGSKPCVQSARYVNKPKIQSAKYVNKPVIMTVNSLSCSMRKNPNYYAPRKLIRIDYYIIPKMIWMRPIHSQMVVAPVHQHHIFSRTVIAPKNSYRINSNYVIEKNRAKISSDMKVKKWYYRWLYSNSFMVTYHQKTITQDYCLLAKYSHTIISDSITKATVPQTINTEYYIKTSNMLNTILMESNIKSTMITTIQSDGEIL